MHVLNPRYNAYGVRLYCVRKTESPRTARRRRRRGCSLNTKNSKHILTSWIKTRSKWISQRRIGRYKVIVARDFRKYCELPTRFYLIHTWYKEIINRTLQVSMTLSTILDFALYRYKTGVYKRGVGIHIDPCLVHIKVNSFGNYSSIYPRCVALRWFTQL